MMEAVGEKKKLLLMMGPIVKRLRKKKSKIKIMHIAHTVKA